MCGEWISQLPAGGWQAQDLLGGPILPLDLAAGQTQVGPPPFSGMQRIGDLLRIAAERDGIFDAAVEGRVANTQQHEQYTNINQRLRQHIGAWPGNLAWHGPYPRP